MTWSPFLRLATPGPTSTTTPAPSWPRIAGKMPSGSAPDSVNSSVWQMPVAFTSISTSPSFGPSRSTSTISSGLPAAKATAARDFMSIDLLSNGGGTFPAFAWLIKSERVPNRVPGTEAGEKCAAAHAEVDAAASMRKMCRRDSGQRSGGMAGEAIRDPILREAMKAERGEAGRPFIHLRVHSAYSLLEGALPLAKIVAHALNDEAPAIAVTDTNNLFGALEFAQKASKEGIQPIVGCQVDVHFGDTAEQAGHGYGRAPRETQPLVLIAATEAGYRNLVKRVSRAYLDVAPGDPIHVELDWLEELAEGIICLTGGPRGPIGALLSVDQQAAA